MLNELGMKLLETSRANGWDILTPEDFFNPPNPDAIPCKLALIHSEVSEALEAYRAGDDVNFAEEMADTAIRLLELAAMLQIDMDDEVRKKDQKNKTRGHKHGGKVV